jgi:hypothetical protein
MPPVGFEPKIPASARPQTHALDRAATGIGAKQSTEIMSDAAMTHCLNTIGVFLLWPGCNRADEPT